MHRIPQFSVLSYLDLLSGDGLQLSLLSNGEAVDEDLRASRDRHFEAVTSLLNLRDALDIFALLDELIRETLDRKLQVKEPLNFEDKELHFKNYPVFHIKNDFKG